MGPWMHVRKRWRTSVSDAVAQWKVITKERHTRNETSHKVDRRHCKLLELLLDAGLLMEWGSSAPGFRELATGLAPATCPPQGAGCRHHSLCQLTDKGLLGKRGCTQQGLRGRPTLATRRKADVTKQPAVLTCHVPEVQSIKKQHPSWMGSLLTHWFWREKVEMIRVPHFQVNAQGLTPALLRSGWIKNLSQGACLVLFCPWAAVLRVGDTKKQLPNTLQKRTERTRRCPPPSSAQRAAEVLQSHYTEAAPLSPHTPFPSSPGLLAGTSSALFAKKAAEKLLDTCCFHFKIAIR